ncbi:MAG TPA: dihydropyrimidinase [Candidatus Paceibacterota bacterium]|nr:dihydropyrimidinase [Verrucomicrobiota bacterium]HSA10405.1 dihydropyrimidinase [Candidatus Paceibacterota bacterium]
MPLLIKGGEIVTASERYVADILCSGETIVRIEPNIPPLPGMEVIDATGKYVFPGFIDPHVHIYLPCLGTFAKDTHETASKAALVGGTTTLIEMLGPDRSQEPMAGFELWLGKAQGHCACDFTFHMTVSRCDERAEGQLREIVKRGISSFKVYLAYKDAFGLSDQELYRALRLARQLGVITTAHCENADLIVELQNQQLEAGKTGPEGHHDSRPPAVEAEGVHHLLTFAELLNAHVYVVHLSCAEALREAAAGKARGVKVWTETVIQHLLLDRTYAERLDFEGAKYVMSPPLRDRKNQESLWNGLRDGIISTVASDHAPFDFATQKRMGEKDFTKIPNGIPALEDRVNTLYTYGVKQGQLDLHQFVDAASTEAAKLFGLYPRKGAIQPGSDADLVIYDPTYRGAISVSTQTMNVDYNPFEGMAIEGRPHIVTLRGQVMVCDGKFVGQTGCGQFLRREPNH